MELGSCTLAVCHVPRGTITKDLGLLRCTVAEVHGQRAGCVFLVRNQDNANMAQLRCLLVVPSARGLGLGRRVVSHCIAFARSADYDGLMLWTNDVLVSARKIYRQPALNWSVNIDIEVSDTTSSDRFGRCGFKLSRDKKRVRTTRLKEYEL